MGGKSTPPTPDYSGIAAQQAASNQQLLQQQTAANRPNQITPWGQMNWTSTGTGPNQQWTGTETLSPMMQNVVTAQQAGQAGAAQQAQGMLGAGDIQALNFSGAPQVQSGQYYNPQAQNAVWNQFQTMQQPLQQQQTEQQQSQLQAQGLRPGDAAYDTAMRNLGNTQYQQQQMAQDQAVLAGEQEAQTMQGMDVQAQNQYMNRMQAQNMGNLNMYNSLMGNQVGGINAPQFATAGMGQTPDLMGAAEQTYGAQLNAANAANAAQGNMYQGIGELGMTAAMLAML